MVMMRMESFYYYVPLFTILSCLVPEGNSIRCYICSFSPDDRNNRTDKCTEDNFQHHKVYSDDCKLGCESVVQYDANEEMEQWRRNCLQEGHKMTNDCETEKTVGWRLVRCSCNRDLCNHSPTIMPSFAPITTLLGALLWSMYLK